MILVFVQGLRMAARPLPIAHHACASHILELKHPSLNCPQFLMEYQEQYMFNEVLAGDGAAEEMETSAH